MNYLKLITVFFCLIISLQMQASSQKMWKHIAIVEEAINPETQTASRLPIDTTREYALILVGRKKTKTFIIGDPVSLELKNRDKGRGVLGQISPTGSITLINKDGVILNELHLDQIKSINGYDLSKKYKAKIAKRIRIAKKSKRPRNGSSWKTGFQIFAIAFLGVLTAVFLFIWMLARACDNACNC